MRNSQSGDFRAVIAFCAGNHGGAMRDRTIAAQENLEPCHEIKENTAQKAPNRAQIGGRHG
ncbi:hypothetical protein FHS91_003944 [Sphingobium xanthum]|uniref:hypothetical protein n=1 Tax=Sphingobium xanthum TaxID=1387165 RepID=UPI001C8B771A|nr:hypothetical protein [Sphingobium xanthum]